MTCIRRAWLTMGERSLELEDVEAGWYCTELDLGWPTIRENTSDLPSQDGTYDRTRLFGARGISANIKTAGAVQIDAIATQFAPFMDPGKRPELHYVLDVPNAPERVITVRAANYAWPLSGGTSREVQLAWVAPDPIPYSTEEKHATVFPYVPQDGFTFDLAFPLVFPAATGGQGVLNLDNAGDFRTYPLLRIFGPCTDPRVDWLDPEGGCFATWFCTIPAGSWFDVNLRRHTMNEQSDPNADRFALIDFTKTNWPALEPGINTIRFTAATQDEPCQLEVVWRDAYLT